MRAKEPKGKKCKVKDCCNYFVPRNSMHSVCGPVCASRMVRDKREREESKKLKEQRRKDRETRDRLKTRSDWIKDAQREFNAFIRERDKAAGWPCISSGRPLDWSGNAVDAGHYRSVGAAPHLRFDERNCHAQSKHDNQYKAGNVVDYRINLIARIGLEAVEALESDNAPKHYTTEDLKEIVRTYRAKRKELVKQSESS
jgi:Bacteriophage Lambda NinG protein